MLRVFTDFNAMTKDNACWNLMYSGGELANLIEKLGIKKGDKIVLYQDEDDFEAPALLDLQYVETLGRKTWVAYPDWSTKRPATAASER